MNNSPELNQLLQALLDELRASKQQLGFGHPPKPRYIYANRKYSDCLWYFWNGAKNEHEPIKFHALTGIVARLEVEQKEYKGQLECKVNLHVCADRKYVIQAGCETLFAKGLLYALSGLPSAAFTQPLIIAVEPGDTEQVLFCRIYNPVTGQSVYAPYPENTNWQEVTQQASAKIDQAHGRVGQPGSVVVTNATEPGKTTHSADNPNRELLKRIGRITGHNSKQIAAILEANYPGRKSNSLAELEVRTVVNAMCTSAAITSGMEQATAQTAFSEWLKQQHSEIGNEELAESWMSQVMF